MADRFIQRPVTFSNVRAMDCSHLAGVKLLDGMFDLRKGAYC
jgi:hypothetical protein